jgi:hypothetical protein
MTSQSIEDYRKRNEDAPLHLVREAWEPVVRLIDGWAKEKIGMRSGYSSQELDDFSRTHGVRFPPTLREWWRLAGRHPFVEIGLVPGKNAKLLAPHHRWLVRCRDFMIVAVDDMQTWSGNGIHVDFLSKPDPEIHGINGTITPDEVPDLNWYKTKYIATGLRLPALIFTTLLYHLFEPSPLVRDDAVYLEGEGDPLLHGKRKPDEPLVSNLELKHFPNETIVGDIYSDGLDIIYFWLLGWACRTEDAAERVRQLVPTQPRRF